jgi:hypothetical protein
MYTSDSIVYRYAGSADPEEEAKYLRQFGCIDQVTDSVIIDRDGDYIQIVTKLKKEGNAKIITITSQNMTALKTTQKEDGTIMGLQLISGYAKGHIYHKELDYFDPIHMVESPYISVNWIVYDSDGDGIFERLECKLISSLDIIQVYHCHLKE